MIPRVECDAEDGDKVFANTHASCTNQKQSPSPHAIDSENTGNSHTDVDDIGGHGNKEGVGDARALEESGAIVEDKVNPRELLEPIG